MSYNELSKNRSYLMGFSILWVVIFHSIGEFNFLPLEIFKRLGFAGVDIFLFLSGIGVYYSLTKNKNKIEFYKKRLLRIYPSYFIVVIFYSLILLISKKITYLEIITNLFMVNFFINLKNTFDWYTPCIMILYLFSPHYIKIKLEKKNIYFMIAFITLLGFFVIQFKLNYLMIFITRIPIFLIGISLGKKVLKKEKIIKKEKIMYFIFFILGILILGISLVKFQKFLRYYGLWWIPFIFITPGMVWTINYLINLLKFKSVLLLLEFLGIYSFEIYLIHERVLKSLNETVKNPYLLNTISIILTIFLAIYLKKIVNRIIKIGVANEDSIYMYKL